MRLETFGQRLNWARRNIAKITQLELRDRMEKEHGVDIGRNYISELELEKAKKRPSFEIVRAMALVMKVSMDFLAGFTENHAPTQDEDTPPHFFSEEADEIAQLIDAMQPDRRALVADLARKLSTPQGERERRLAESLEILDSIERDMGRDVRLRVEAIYRSRGIGVSPTL